MHTVAGGVWVGGGNDVAGAVITPPRHHRGLESVAGPGAVALLRPALGSGPRPSINSWTPPRGLGRLACPGWPSPPSWGSREKRPVSAAQATSPDARTPPPGVGGGAGRGQIAGLRPWLWPWPAPLPRQDGHSVSPWLSTSIPWALFPRRRRRRPSRRSGQVLPFDDERDFDEARRGFIAAPGVPADHGRGRARGLGHRRLRLPARRGGVRQHPPVAAAAGDPEHGVRPVRGGARARSTRCAGSTWRTSASSAPTPAGSCSTR